MTNELWLKYMEKLKTDRSRFTTDDIFNVVGFISGYSKRIPKGIIEQIKRDMGDYSKYDAIAMWINESGGLIEYEPKFIKKLVTIFGIEE